MRGLVRPSNDCVSPLSEVNEAKFYSNFFATVREFGLHLRVSK
jgi:hypothetical protein